VCTVSRPSIDLQQLGCVRHNVDGNCLFYTITHQAGLIGRCHGDQYVANPFISLYAEISRCVLGRCRSMGAKKLVQHAQWGDLEIRLLAVAIE